MITMILISVLPLAGRATRSDRSKRKEFDQAPWVPPRNTGMHFVNLNLALSAFSLFRGSSMLTLRPIDPVAIEKRLESPDALVISASASTIDAADVDELPPRGLQRKKPQPRFIGKRAGRTQARRGARRFIGSDIRPLNRIHQTMATMKRSELRPLSYPARGFSRIAPRQPRHCRSIQRRLGQAPRISAMAAHAAALPTASVTSRE